LYVLKEGMPAWEEKGFPLYAGPDYEKRITGTFIAPGDFMAMKDARPGAIVLVDVREADEYAAGHIPGAINIPATTFAPAAGLDRGRKIIIYCSIGARSYTAYRKLKKMAFPDVAQMRFADWQEAGLPIERQ
jgi:rhodanese-related sulfurtransferase